MQAIRFHTIGGPDVLKLEEVEKPRPGAGEALVRIHVAGVNFADTLFRRGRYARRPQFPETPGFEAAGVVEEVGEGVAGALVGRRVTTIGGQHCYAEYTVAPAEQLIFLPDKLSLEAGAAFPIQSLTAYHLLYTVDQVKPGMSVLVHAAAGGVGLQAVQMAKQAGARVFGTTSTEEKAKLAREMGADEVILYNKVDFAERIKNLTEGRGVDLVLDSVGRTTFAGNLKCLAALGHVILYGIAGGSPEPVNIMASLFERSLKVSAFYLYTLSQRPEVVREGIQRVISWIADDKLKIVIGLKLPLAQAAEAHRKMEGRETVGKILLTLD
jgi:NADPH2:quinone reductase